ncbi:unnamed protein product [Pylaiella littoralis]
MDITESDHAVAVENRNGVVVKTEGKFADDKVCPIARNAALLEELDVAEGKVAELLEVAAEALDEIAGVESLDSSKVETHTKRFLGLVSSVHGTLSSKAALIRDYTPYPRSIYGPRKELEILHEKASFLRATLADLSTAQQEEAEACASPAAAAGGRDCATGSPPPGKAPATTTAPGIATISTTTAPATTATTTTTAPAAPATATASATAKATAPPAPPATASTTSPPGPTPNLSAKADKSAT